MDGTRLRTLYQEAESASKSIHAEQRSNIRLVAGIHYQKRGSRFSAALRRVEKLTKSNQIRLTKNHIARITKHYRNEILSYAPSVTVTPKNKSERSDQKVAEISSSVWEDLKEKNKLKKLMRELCQDFIDIGEAYCLLKYDYDRGEFLGYDVDEDENGVPKLDEEGEPIAKPDFRGSFHYERVLGFNVLIDPTARSWEEAQYVIIRKMISTKELRQRYKGNEEILKLVDETVEQTRKIFDNNGSLSESKGMTMVREYYFRPCATRPKGHYYMTIEDGILHEGELPAGLFPIHKVGFDDLPTSARSQSIIAVCRPFQAEINRCASRIAYTQCTIGDDKIVVTNGGNISAGATAHGVKTIRVNGGDITHLQGRGGDQFLDYMYREITQMYEAVDLQYDSQEKQSQFDPNSMLFASIHNKKKFSLYVDKWIDFVKEICETSLRLAKHYYDAETLIPVIGKKEWINVDEFKSQEDLGFQIVVEEQSEDVTSKMGRHITMSNILQYAGGQMDKREIGGVIRALPFFNEEEAVSDLTLDYDNIKNDILAMDRGVERPVNPNDPHEYYIKHLTKRMKEQDFEQLDPQIQQMYSMKMQGHVQAFEQQEQQRERLKQGLIPSQGYLVPCDFYIKNPSDPTKAPRKAKVPYDSLAWLMEQLESQGQSQMTLDEMQGQALNDLEKSKQAQAMQQAPQQFN